MIHAGTIRIGSGCTVRASWASTGSARSGGCASPPCPGSPPPCLPGTNCSAPAGGSPSVSRRQSSAKLAAPFAKFMPNCDAGRAQHLGIGPGKVRRRPEVQQLAHGEGHHVFVVRRHAAHARGGVPPPLLPEEEPLVDGVERPLLPGLARRSASPAAAARCSADRHRRARRGRGNWRSAAPCASTCASTRPACPAPQRGASPSRRRRAPRRRATARRWRAPHRRAPRGRPPGPSARGRRNLRLVSLV